MYTLPKVAVSGLDKEVILIQGGMGAGVSLAPLAGAVADRGGVGTVSFVALDRMVSHRLGRKVGQQEAARLELERARGLAGGRGAIAINLMVLIKKLYALSVLGAIEGGVDFIMAGAGLPMNLPELTGAAEVGLVPIVSSGKALELICRGWRRKYNRIPDAVILEGPLAGGHLGFHPDDVPKPEFQLERLFPEVKAVAMENGDFPVIVAGGIYSHEDIVRWVKEGADGVQMGTRFAATVESGASDEFKRAIVASCKEDILVAMNPGSPSGLPFRVIKTSPGYLQALEQGRPLLCDKQYLLHERDGKLTCRALEGHGSFCICNALLSAVGVNDTDDLPVFTVGAAAWRVDRIMRVNELIDELTGIPAC